MATQMHTEAVEALIKMLETTGNLEVQIGVVEGLGYAGGAKASDALLKVLQTSHNTKLTAAASKALGRSVSDNR